MNQEKLQSFATDILESLYYIHLNGIVHSDLKLQNALVQKPEDEDEGYDFPSVKLCDFGLSHILRPEFNGKALMAEKCGTSGYIAPEIQSKNTLVGPEIDMWSFGVMLYEMCTAYKPTKLLNYRYGKNTRSPNFLIGSGPLPFRDRDWKRHNKHIKDLI
jgi:serine/threonine protein kinase KIN1/2